jgi:3' exoribonuclease, RNase T-like
VTWFIECKIQKVWSHGAVFDVPLWQEAICAVTSEAPWKHWNVRDTRTLYELAGLDVRTMQRKGVEHSALDDANFQIDCVAAAYNKLGQRLT